MCYTLYHGPLTRHVKIAGYVCARNTRNVFPATDLKGNHWLAISACITARAWPTCRDASRDRYPRCGENVPGIPGACAIRNFAYLARGPWQFSLVTFWRRVLIRSSTGRFSHTAQGYANGIGSIILLHQTNDVDLINICTWITCILWWRHFMHFYA